MKSIDKLRELADKLDDAATRMSEHGFSPIGIKASIIADEIEAEIAANYMLLPVDADGVPIHVGDVVAAQDEQPFEVRAFQLDSLGWFAIERLGSQWNVNQLHHVKPRTLEDVLTEMLDRNTDGVGLREFNRDFGAFVAHYADEIRELLGGDAE